MYLYDECYCVRTTIKWCAYCKVTAVGRVPKCGVDVWCLSQCKSDHRVVRPREVTAGRPSTLVQGRWVRLSWVRVASLERDARIESHLSVFNQDTAVPALRTRRRVSAECPAAWRRPQFIGGGQWAAAAAAAAVVVAALRRAPRRAPSTRLRWQRALWAASLSLSQARQRNARQDSKLTTYVSQRAAWPYNILVGSFAKKLYM